MNLVPGEALIAVIPAPPMAALVTSLTDPLSVPRFVWPLTVNPVSAKHPIRAQRIFITPGKAASPINPNAAPRNRLD